MPRPNVEPQRRRQILDAAARVFAERGLASARMEDVAAVAGISKGTVYLYFAGKRELVLALVDDLYGSDVARMQAEADDGSAEAQLRRLASGLAAATSGGAALVPLVLEIYSAGARDDAVRDRLAAYFAAYRERIATILRTGEERGELRCSAGVDAAAQTLVGAFEGVFWMWVLADRRLDLASALDDVITTALDGLRLRSPTPRAPRAGTGRA